MNDRKVCLITGATSGIGLETAKGLVSEFDLILISRNQAKADATLTELKQINPEAQIDSYIADLSLLHEVNRAAELVLANHKSIDVLINNAGTVISGYELTAEGLEKTFATNHLSAFLLTQMLLPLLKAAAEKTGEARVVTVASNAHLTGRIDFEQLEVRSHYNSYRAYADSKLMNVLFALELDRRLKHEGFTQITSNCLHPGVVRTGFSVGGKGLFERIFSLFRPFMISASQGAATSIYLASSTEVKGISGQYFSHQKSRTPSRLGRDPQLAARLWEASESIVQKVLSSPNSQLA
jgi:NAD(P)-dependent dehydrogenase (short-subunit alcohol dehydrogenase family)